MIWPRHLAAHLFEYRVYAYNFIDENKVGAQYWRDVGTIELLRSNMDLVSVSPVFNLYDKLGLSAPDAQYRREDVFADPSAWAWP